MLSLNEVGTFIWESFKDGASLGGVVEKVIETFETTPERAESDAREFVHTLMEKEMLVPAVSP